MTLKTHSIDVVYWHDIVEAYSAIDDEEIDWSFSQELNVANGSGMSYCLVTLPIIREGISDRSKDLEGRISLENEEDETDVDLVDQWQLEIDDCESLLTELNGLAPTVLVAFSNE